VLWRLNPRDFVEAWSFSNGYDDVVDYSPDPGELLPWMGTVGSPTYSYLVQLAKVEPLDTHGDFFSQLSRVTGYYSGSESEALSWLGGEARAGEVLASRGFANFSQASYSTSWCSPPPLVPEGSFSPIQCGFFPSSPSTNISWSFLDPTVTVSPSLNHGDPVGFSEVSPEVALEGSTLGPVNWFHWIRVHPRTILYPYVDQGFFPEQFSWGAGGRVYCLQFTSLKSQWVGFSFIWGAQN
jgi:hypothetical protein